MKKVIVRALPVLTAAWLAGASPADAQIHVDAALRLSDHLILAVVYGDPYVRGGVTYYDAYYYDDHGRRHHRVRRYQASEHRRYHRAIWREHAHLHSDLRRGYVGYGHHDRWHRAVDYEHRDVHHDLDHTHHKAHKKGKGRHQGRRN